MVVLGVVSVVYVRLLIWNDIGVVVEAVLEDGMRLLADAIIWLRSSSALLVLRLRCRHVVQSDRFIVSPSKFCSGRQIMESSRRRAGL